MAIAPEYRQVERPEYIHQVSEKKGRLLRWGRAGARRAPYYQLKGRRHTRTLSGIRKGKKCPDDAVRVFWDLETTGMGTPSRITSIGWTAEVGHEGELFVMPEIEISPGATRVHGHTRHTLEKAGALDVKHQLRAFIDTLGKVAPKVILCAHNGKSFDTHVLRAELHRSGLELPSNVAGFADTMRWIKHDLGVKPASMDALMSSVLGMDIRTIHNAMEDSRLLYKIVRALEDTHKKRVGFFESVDDWLLRTQRTAETANSFGGIF